MCAVDGAWDEHGCEYGGREQEAAAHTGHFAVGSRFPAPFGLKGLAATPDLSEVEPSEEQAWITANA
jgi:hypothetical protein